MVVVFHQLASPWYLNYVLVVAPQALISYTAGFASAHREPSYVWKLTEKGP